MTLYTALDVSLRSVAICVVDEQGEVRHATKVEADVDRIVTCPAVAQYRDQRRRLRGRYAHSVFDLWIASGGVRGDLP